MNILQIILTATNIFNTWHCDSLCRMRMMYIISFFLPSQQSYRMGTLIVPILQKSKLRPRLGNLSEAMGHITAQRDLKQNIWFQHSGTWSLEFTGFEAPALPVRSFLSLASLASLPAHLSSFLKEHHLHSNFQKQPQVQAEVIFFLNTLVLRMTSLSNSHIYHFFLTRFLWLFF